MDAAGLEHEFDALGIKRESDRDKIIENVNLERLGNNPVEITEPVLRGVVGGC